jgi:membrane-associated protease RseP (regulator of RpoE activity)
MDREFNRDIHHRRMRRQLAVKMRFRLLAVQSLMQRENRESTVKRVFWRRQLTASSWSWNGTFWQRVTGGKTSMKVAFVTVLVATCCSAVLAQPAEAPPGPSADDHANEVASILAEMQAFEAPELGLLIAPAPHGELLIIGIRPNSAAERAGLRRGDFVVKVDGEDVPSVEELKAAIRAGRPRRESANVTVWRGGKESEVELMLSKAERSQESKPRPWAGIQFDEVPGKGLVVKSVYPGGPADQAGLQVGDLIVSADGTKIQSFVDAERYLQELQPLAEAKVVVLRDGQQRAVNIKTASLHVTPQGLVLKTGAGDPAAVTAPQEYLAPEAAAVEQARWEAEQRQRLEQLLQEIRQDIKELKTKLETPEKNE